MAYRMFHVSSPPHVLHGSTGLCLAFDSSNTVHSLHPGEQPETGNPIADRGGPERLRTEVRNTRPTPFPYVTLPFVRASSIGLVPGEQPCAQITTDLHVCPKSFRFI